MTDPTLPVLTSCFCSALVLFVVGALVRWRANAKTAPSQPLSSTMESDFTDPAVFPGRRTDGLPGGGLGSEWPYATPGWIDGQGGPPPLPGQGREEATKTGFFQKIDLFGIGAVYVIFFFLALASALAAEDPGARLDRETLVASIGMQFMLAGMVMMFVTMRVRTTAWLGLHWAKWPLVFLIAPLAVCLMWGVFAVLQFSGYIEWMESLGVEAVQDTVKLLQSSNDPWVLGLMAGAAVIAAPICEEVVFRGYLYGAAKRFTGPWVAGIFSALVFGGAHGSLSALLPLVLFGGLLAFIYEKTGSIWAPMAVHLCFNGATVLAQLLSRAQELPLQSIK